MNKIKGLWVIVPHRGVADGKSRLAGVLDAAARRALNVWLLERTLRVMQQAAGDQPRCLVVSPCADTLALARAAGAQTLLENTGVPSQSLNAALSQAAAHAATLGAQRLLILPADLPRLDAAALQAMLALPAHANANDMVIAADRHGSGTNALWVSAAVRDFAFGKASYAQHAALAEARGGRVLPCTHAALAFDLDTPEDFALWARSGEPLPDFLAGAVRATEPVAGRVA